MRENRLIQRILSSWETEGLLLNEQGSPVHPELYFRLDGQWTGWCSFLGIAEGEPSFFELSELDRIEGYAFTAYQHYVVGNKHQAKSIWNMSNILHTQAVQ